MYKNNCSILDLTKGSCKFATSDFPAENPGMQTRNYFYTNRCQQFEKNYKHNNINHFIFFII